MSTPKTVLRAQQLDLSVDAQGGQVEIEELDVEPLGGDVDRRVERVRPAAERARIAARTVFALDQRDPAPGLRQARRGGETAEAGADHDNVVLLGGGRGR